MSCAYMSPRIMRRASKPLTNRLLGVILLMHSGIASNIGHIANLNPVSRERGLSAPGFFPGRKEVSHERSNVSKCVCIGVG